MVDVKKLVLDLGVVSKNLIFGIGIIIVFGLVLWQGIETFSPSPEYSDFCDEFKTAEVIENRDQCEAIGGRWNADGFPRPIRSVDGESIEVAGFCERDFTCRGEYEEARDAHSWVVFVVSLIAGLIVLVVGYSILKVEPVGSALIGSGVWAIFWGSAINWRNFSSIWRFLLLLLALAVLIGFAMRLNKGPKGKGKK